MPRFEIDELLVDALQDVFLDLREVVLLDPANDLTKHWLEFWVIGIRVDPMEKIVLNETLYIETLENISG
jgi:hypothetical protein